MRCPLIVLLIAPLAFSHFSVAAPNKQATMKRLSKLGVSSRRETIALAIEHKLVN